MNKRIIAAAILLALLGAVGLAAAEKLPKPATKEALKLMEQAEKAVKDKKYDDALKLYEEVQKLEPNYAPSYLIAASVYRMKQDDESALKSMEKAVQLNPGLAPAVDAYAQLLSVKAKEASSQGRPADALPYFSRIVAIPDFDKTHKGPYIDSLFNMGICAFQAQKFQASLETFTKLLAIPSIDSDYKQMYVLGQYMMGFNLSFLEKPEEANPYLAKYVELVSGDPSNAFAPIADYMIAKNKYALLDREVAKLRADTAVTDLRGKTKEAAGRYVDIPELLGKAIAAKPDLEDAYLVLGNYDYLIGNLDAAIGTYKTLLEKFAASPNKAEYEAFLKKLEEEKAKAAEPKK